ncbi:hypothetical protein CRG98_023102 [Punica granatum]|uniref:CCHC-type domain-containing protein n=1 Tax=Punica granatum TaxID=22663 RepID=A0A2I0JJL5_PUNGR|nr:hypothetical protein CRG98_023102 [Punica granatum]
MKAFMEGADLWDAVVEDYDIVPLPANPTLNQIKIHKERVTRKANAKSCLYSVVSPTMFTRIMRLDSVKAIWDYLKDKYEGDERIRGMKALNLVREFEKLQMQEGQNVREYVEKLVQIANKVRIMGSNISDERLVQKILVSVPEKFEATIASLENTRELSDLKLSKVLSALEAQEHIRILRKEEPVEGALPANDAGKQGNTSTWNQERKWSASPCKHCGKKGHAYFKCWRRPDVKCKKCHKIVHMVAICKEKHTEHQGES